MKRFGTIAKAVKDRIKLHNLPVVAAGIAFWGFLAMIPAATGLIMVYDLVADPADIEEQIAEFDLPENVSGIILDPIENAEEESADADDGDGSNVGKITGVVVALALSLWAASGAIKHLMAALNGAFEETETRKFLPLRGAALGLTLGAIALICATMFVLGALDTISDWLGLGDAGKFTLAIVRFPILVGLILAALVVLYRVGPDHHRPRSGWLEGAAVAVGIMIPAIVVIALFAGPITSGSFAALGGIALSMVMLVALAAAVLIGAEWIAATQTDRAEQVGPELLLASSPGSNRAPEEETFQRSGNAASSSPDVAVNPKMAKAMAIGGIANAVIDALRGRDQDREG